MSTVLHDTSAFLGNLVKMRIFLGSSTQKYEKVRESPFEKPNQTGPKKKFLIEKNLKSTIV